MNFLPPVPGSGDAGEVEEPDDELLEEYNNNRILEHFRNNSKEIRNLILAMNRLNTQKRIYNALKEVSHINTNDNHTNSESTTIPNIDNRGRESNDDRTNTSETPGSSAFDL